MCREKAVERGKEVCNAVKGGQSLQEVSKVAGWWGWREKGKKALLEAEVTGQEVQKQSWLW